MLCLPGGVSRVFTFLSPKHKEEKKLLPQLGGHTFHSDPLGQRLTMSSRDVELHWMWTPAGWGH